MERPAATRRFAMPKRTAMPTTRRNLRLMDPPCFEPDYFPSGARNLGDPDPTRNHSKYPFTSRMKCVGAALCTASVPPVPRRTTELFARVWPVRKLIAETDGAEAPP